MISNHCSHCCEEIIHQKHFHSGKTYCSSCYSLFFKILTCTTCNNRKRIHHLLSPPICDQCRYKKIPCVRCNKVGVKLGKVDSNGPVCISCIRYLNTPRLCEHCKKQKYDINRRTLRNSTAAICARCYRKTLPICSRCGYRRKAYFYSIEREPICKICSTEEIRVCKTCGCNISAGTGHYCTNCSYTKTLHRRIANGKDELSPFLSDQYEQFGVWLLNNRGSIFSATHIQSYLPYFLSLDKLAFRLGKVPSYRDIVDEYTVAVTRQYLLVTQFLDEKKIVSTDESIKNDYSSLDTINRYLRKFARGSSHSKMLLRYYEYLEAKLNKGRTSIRSIRLSLTPAVKFLDACAHFGLNKPNNDVLFGMLWVSPGQRSALTGFINFLNKQYKLGLVMPEKEDIIIQRPNKSRAQLKQRLISLLRKPIDTDEYKNDLLLVSLAYFHGVSIPRYTIVNANMIIKNSKGDHYLRLGGHVLNLPTQLFM